MPLNVGQQKVKDNRELSPTGVRKPRRMSRPPLDVTGASTCL